MGVQIPLGPTNFYMKPQTQEEKNIAVARSRGWRFDVIENEWDRPKNTSDQRFHTNYSLPPDYCNDRNAIAEAVAAQDNFGFKLRYTAMLPLIIHGSSSGYEESERRAGSTIHLLSLIEATAEQRVDAYLAAL